MGECNLIQDDIKVEYKYNPSKTSVITPSVLRARLLIWIKVLGRALLIPSVFVVCEAKSQIGEFNILRVRLLSSFEHFVLIYLTSRSLSPSILHLCLHQSFFHSSQAPTASRRLFS